MENRYDSILQNFNQDIIQLAPSNVVLRSVAAHEFKAFYKSGMRVLEIGCGEGDSAEPLLHITHASMTLLDASAEMIQRCKYRLAQYAAWTEYVCADAMVHLRTSPKYDIIVSSWTIHNFLVSEQLKLFSAICGRLPKGGTLLLMDKIYPEHGGKELLEIQNKRYRYLDPVVAKAIIAHEECDYSPQYRMEEVALIRNLHDIGFRGIRIADRCERDIVLVVQK